MCYRDKYIKGLSFNRIGWLWCQHSPKPAFLHIKCYYFLKQQHFMGLVLYLLMLLVLCSSKIRFKYCHNGQANTTRHLRKFWILHWKLRSKKAGIRRELKFFLFHKQKSLAIESLAKSFTFEVSHTGTSSFQMWTSLWKRFPSSYKWIA